MSRNNRIGCVCVCVGWKIATTGVHTATWEDGGGERKAALTMEVNSEYVRRRARTHYGAMECGWNDVIVLSTIGDDINVNLFDSWVFIGSGDRIFLNNIMSHSRISELELIVAGSICLWSGNIPHYDKTFERVEWPILWTESRLIKYYSTPGSSCARIHREAQENVISFLSSNWKCVGPRLRNWIIRVDRCRRFPRSENRDLNKHAQSHSSYACGTQRSTKSEFTVYFIFFVKCHMFIVPYGCRAIRRGLHDTFYLNCKFSRQCLCHCPIWLTG